MASTCLCPSCRTPFDSVRQNFQLEEAVVSARLNKNFEALFKIALVGDQSVGKTSIARIFEGHHMENVYQPTIGYAFSYIDEMYKGNVYRIQIWDTAGQEMYRAIQKSHYQSTIV
jgi:GTPase SAR1 family protein